MATVIIAETMRSWGWSGYWGIPSGRTGQDKIVRGVIAIAKNMLD